MRNRYLVCYDITDDRRLYRVARLLRGFGGRQQYSVFQCDLSAVERVRLVAALLDTVHQREDRVMIVDLGPISGRGQSCTEYLGRRPESGTSGPAIV